VSGRPLASRFVLGYVGIPGKRTFLIEVDDAGGRVWYLLEKGQVAVFADEAGALLEQLGLLGSGRAIDPGEVNEPGRVEFRVGQITIEVDQERARIDVTLLPVEPGDPPVMHTISPPQLDAAVRVAQSAVAQGRPKCPRCGLAMDPEGHNCPTTNGDLRHHQP
jgi:uncharacterized repeat protein (TIGR03847 family)